MTTSSSTTSAPALRRSVRTLGQDVILRPRTTSASTSVHGPWQMTATGLPERHEVAHERDRAGVQAQLVGVARAARQHEAVVVVDRGVPDEPVDAERVGRLDVAVHRLDLAVLERQQLGQRAGLDQRLARLFELDLLDAVGGEDRDRASREFVGHGSSVRRGSLLAPVPGRPGNRVRRERAALNPDSRLQARMQPRQQRRALVRAAAVDREPAATEAPPVQARRGGQVRGLAGRVLGVEQDHRRHPAALAGAVKDAVGAAREGPSLESCGGARCAERDAGVAEREALRPGR